MNKIFILITVCGLILTSCSSNVQDFPAEVAAPIVDTSSSICDTTYAKKIIITCDTEEATIYYTIDGSDPVLYGNEYTGPFYVSVKDTTVTVKAVALKNGMTNSLLRTSVVLDSFYAAPPVISTGADWTLEGGSIVLSTTTPGATIYYTTNLNNPTKSVHQKYTGPFTLDIETDPKMVKAIAVVDGMEDSSISVRDFTPTNYVIRPVIDIDSTFTTSTELIITCETDGAKIQFSLDNGITWDDYPTDGTTKTITASAQILAKATKSGLQDSAVTPLIIVTKE